MKLKKFISFISAMVIASLNCSVPKANCNLDESNYSKEKLVEKQIVMLENEVPEAIDYKIAKEKGHCERLYLEEPNLNTMIFKNTDNSNSFYYFNYPVKYYDEQGIEFSNENCKIKTTHEYSATVNSEGFYETENINSKNYTTIKNLKKK